MFRTAKLLLITISIILDIKFKKLGQKYKNTYCDQLSKKVPDTLTKPKVLK